MKRIIIAVLLIGIAAIAGMFRSHSKSANVLAQLPGFATDSSAGNTHEEIRKTVELSKGAQVEISGINGTVKVETSDSQTAEIYVDRTGQDRETLERRKVTIENGPTSLRIHGETGDVGFFGRLFGSNPTERVTLKLPRQISLLTKGVNGSVMVGEVDGPVQVQGINGRVDIAQASGTAEFKGINGNISVSISTLTQEGLSLRGINGNIDLRLSEGLNADLEARGMNGHVVSDLPDVLVEKLSKSKYFAHIGTGGNPISVRGINGNIRLGRAMTASSVPAEPRSKG